MITNHHANMSGPFLLNVKRGNDVETTEIRSLMQVVGAAMQYVNDDEEFADSWAWLAEYLKTSLLARGVVEIGCNDLDLVKEAAEEEEKVNGEIAAITIEIKQKDD